MGVFIFGKTEKCCVDKCEKIATHWTGWLRKSRDGIVAGFCDEHNIYPPNERNTYGQHNLRGIYNKGMGEAGKCTTEKSVRNAYGLDKNIIEQ